MDTATSSAASAFPYLKVPAEARCKIISALLPGKILKIQTDFVTGDSPSGYIPFYKLAHRSGVAIELGSLHNLSLTCRIARDDVLTVLWRRTSIYMPEMNPYKTPLGVYFIDSCFDYFLQHPKFLIRPSASLLDFLSSIDCGTVSNLKGWGRDVYALKQLAPNLEEILLSRFTSDMHSGWLNRFYRDHMPDQRPCGWKSKNLEDKAVSLAHVLIIHCWAFVFTKYTTREGRIDKARYGYQLLRLGSNGIIDEKRTLQLQAALEYICSAFEEHGECIKACT